MTGPDHALRVQAGRVLVQVSVQRARLLGLYQHEGATENAPQDFLEFLEEFWERRRARGGPADQQYRAEGVEEDSLMGRIGHKELRRRTISGWTRAGHLWHAAGVRCASP